MKGKPMDIKDMPDKYTMAWQITMVTNYTEDFLLGLEVEELYEIYKVKVEKR
jgi:hypothetical protein